MDGDSHGMAAPDIFADLECMFLHALLGAALQEPLLVRHPHGAPTLLAPGLTRWAAVGGKTGPKWQ